MGFGHSRKFLGVAAVLCLFTTAPRAQTVELKVSNYNPPGHTTSKVFEAWAADVGKRSNGRLKLTLFPSGQMGPIQRQYDLARTGVADIAYVLHGSLPGRFPLTEIAQLPYVFDRGGKALSTSEASGILTELVSPLAAEHQGVKPLALIATPTLSLFFSKATVRSPADMRGLRMRHNGPIGAAMLEAWGAAPAALPPPELSDALSKGTIGGMLFNYEASQAYQVAESLTSVTPLNASAATFALVMNADKYKSLPEDLRKVIDETTGPAMARRLGASLDEAELEGRKYLEAANVRILDLSAAERNAFEDAVKPITAAMLAKAEGKGVKAKEFLEQIRAKVGAP